MMMDKITINAAAKRIEVTSFINPERVQQMAGLTGQVTMAASFGCLFKGKVVEDDIAAAAAGLANRQAAVMASASIVDASIGNLGGH